MRFIDRLFGVFGVPSAVRHGRAIQGLDAAISMSNEVGSSARDLTSAARALEASLMRGRD